eukprot:PhM_4_TR7989/c0_g1_i2/m.83661
MARPSWLIRCAEKVSSPTHPILLLRIAVCFVMCVSYVCQHALYFTSTQLMERLGNAMWIIQAACAALNIFWLGYIIVYRLPTNGLRYGAALVHFASSYILCAALVIDSKDEDVQASSEVPVIYLTMLPALFELFFLRIHDTLIYLAHTLYLIVILFAYLSNTRDAHMLLLHLTMWGTVTAVGSLLRECFMIAASAHVPMPVQYALEDLDFEAAHEFLQFQHEEHPDGWGMTFLRRCVGRMAFISSFVPEVVRRFNIPLAKGRGLDTMMEQDNMSMSVSLQRDREYLAPQQHDVQPSVQQVTIAVFSLPNLFTASVLTPWESVSGLLSEFVELVQSVTTDYEGSMHSMHDADIIVTFPNVAFAVEAALEVKRVFVDDEYEERWGTQFGNLAGYDLLVAAVQREEYNFTSCGVIGSSGFRTMALLGRIDDVRRLARLNCVLNTRGVLLTDNEADGLNVMRHFSRLVDCIAGPRANPGSGTAAGVGIGVNMNVTARKVYEVVLTPRLGTERNDELNRMIESYTEMCNVFTSAVVNYHDGNINAALCAFESLYAAQPNDITIKRFYIVLQNLHGEQQQASAVVSSGEFGPMVHDSAVVDFPRAWVVPSVVAYPYEMVDMEGLLGNDNDNNGFEFGQNPFTE